MSDLLTDLIPLNLIEEKEKFFSDRTYNPQFRYSRVFDEHELTRWGKPQQKLVEYCAQQLKRNLYEPGDDSKNYVSEADIRQHIEAFNQQHHLAAPLTVHFSEKTIVRCRVDGRKIIFQLPILYTKDTLSDLLRHELETHILRSLNHQLQGWDHYSRKSEDFRRTEEGLANLHTYLYRPDKSIAKTLLSYYAVALAQRSSFAEEYQALTEMGYPESRAWNLTLRTKRGLTDTTFAGGFTKDITYLEGSIAVWNWLMDSANNPEDLYVGRFALSEIPEHAKLADRTKMIYPSFFADMNAYHKHIMEIGQQNGFAVLTDIAL